LLYRDRCFDLLVRRLLRNRDVGHAHGPGFDLAVPRRRRRSGYGLRLDILGNRTDNFQAASQGRSPRAVLSRAVFMFAVTTDASHSAHCTSWTPRGRLGTCAGYSSQGTKKQGRRRSIPSTTLPAPDIEIGSRHPVKCTLQGISTDKYETVHTRLEKIGGKHRFVLLDDKLLSQTGC